MKALGIVVFVIYRTILFILPVAILAFIGFVLYGVVMALMYALCLAMLVKDEVHDKFN